MSKNSYRSIKNIWDRYVLEEEVSRKSVAGIEKSMDTLLKKGPQRKGGSLKNVDDMLPGKEDEEDISAPPGAPGGLEENSLDEIVAVGASVIPLVRGWHQVMKLLARAPWLEDQTRSWAQGHLEASQKYIEFLDDWNKKYPTSYNVVAATLGSLDWAGTIAGKGAEAAAGVAYSALEKMDKLKDPMPSYSKVSPDKRPTEPIGSKPPVRRRE